MPFEKGGYNPTTAYDEAKKPKKIPSEEGKSIQYPYFLSNGLFPEPKRKELDLLLDLQAFLTITTTGGEIWTNHLKIMKKVS
jgi:hypothetical protein